MLTTVVKRIRRIFGVNRSIGLIRILEECAETKSIKIIRRHTYTYPNLALIDHNNKSVEKEVSILLVLAEVRR
jgi:hypothetical protein